ncbi:hypothetical protein [Paenarthrobacter sp. JL.01a]|uniref:hypothetical protein n=1 Tax=Paenarthrobacter sp. JL.01a TaxID=2979324 RepID=UPI0021C991FF|nr:hypothetical protein [Paenarthrobacter sp. JL.01a]UXM90937.1 hypothetical protein N5P29_16800 [Paenarthrobacter sp. JL.01a]
MSAVSERTRTTVRHEYIIPSPACWTDVQLAMHLASEARKAAGLSVNYDDVVKVESDDDYVIVFWEETK